MAVGTGVLTAVIATMAGYGFARFPFRGSGIVFALVLVTMMIPFQALLTPLFLEMHSLGLTNNLAGLALFYTTFNLPFGVFVMRNTFLQIPWELSGGGHPGPDASGISPRPPGQFPAVTFTRLEPPRLAGVSDQRAAAQGPHAEGEHGQPGHLGRQRARGSCDALLEDEDA